MTTKTGKQIGAVIVVHMGQERTDVLSVCAYPDTKPGNKAANRRFARLARALDKHAEQGDIDDALADGYYDLPSGEIIMVLHSFSA